MKKFLPFALIVAGLAGAADKVDIYWIDVEGGASTLVVTDSGHAVLMDAGYSGFDDRDAKRIERVVKKEAGLDKMIASSHRIFTGTMSATSQPSRSGS